MKTVKTLRELREKGTAVRPAERPRLHAFPATRASQRRARSARALASRAAMAPPSTTMTMGTAWISYLCQSGLPGSSSVTRKKSKSTARATARSRKRASNIRQ